MKFLNLVFLSLLIIKISSSQPKDQKTDSVATLIGTVIDYATQKPLLGANIILENTSLGAASDVDGKFSIKYIKQGTYTVKCNLIGYESVKQQVVLKPNEIKDINIKIYDEDEYWSRKVEEDIENGDVKFLVGGLAILDGAHEEAAAKFGFKYELMGCTFVYGNKYNEQVEAYLERKYGPNWRKKFNEEVQKIRDRESKN